MPAHGRTFRNRHMKPWVVDASPGGHDRPRPRDARLRTCALVVLLLSTAVADALELECCRDGGDLDSHGGDASSVGSRPCACARPSPLCCLL